MSMWEAEQVKLKKKKKKKVDHASHFFALLILQLSSGNSGPIDWLGAFIHPPIVSSLKRDSQYKAHIRELQSEDNGTGPQWSKTIPYRTFFRAQVSWHTSARFRLISRRVITYRAWWMDNREDAVFDCTCAGRWLAPEVKKKKRLGFLLPPSNQYMLPAAIVY